MARDVTVNLEEVLAPLLRCLCVRAKKAKG